MKVQSFAKQMRAVAIVGTVTALLFLVGTHTGAQGAQDYSLVSVCVNQSTGAMRMVLKASPLPANCSADEQFIQLVQTPPGTQQTGGPRASNGSRSDHGFWELAGRHGEAGITGGGTPGDNAVRRVAYYASEGSGADSGSGAGNQPQATPGNSGGSTPPNQAGAYGPNGTFIPAPAPTGGNSGGSIPPNQRGAWGPNGFTPAPGPTGGKSGGSTPQNQSGASPGAYATTLYAPLVIKDKATGQRLAQFVNTGKGGVWQIGDAKGNLVASIGTAPSGMGGYVEALDLDAVIRFGWATEHVYGTFQIISGSGRRVAELGPGKNGQVGLRIFNPAGVEVATLEDLSGAPFGGGLMIHNAAGGAVAWITPNSDGTLGIVHAVSIPMPVP